MFEILYKIYNDKINNYGVIKDDLYIPDKNYYKLYIKIFKSFILINISKYMIKGNYIRRKKVYRCFYNIDYKLWYFLDCNIDILFKNKYFAKILNRYKITPEMFLQRIEKERYDK